MQRIELDFIRRAPRSRWAGRVLLACALGLAGDLAVSYVRLAQTVNANEAIVAHAIEPFADALLHRFPSFQAAVMEKATGRCGSFCFTSWRTSCTCESASALLRLST